MKIYGIKFFRNCWLPSRVIHNSMTFKSPGITLHVIHFGRLFSIQWYTQKDQ